MLFRTAAAAVGLYMTLIRVTCSEPSACITCRQSGACGGDDCFCCREELMVPFKMTNAPQIVYFSSDDALPSRAAGYFRQLFDSSRRNPNGCPISMTLFVANPATNYTYVTEFYHRGMEIASHTVTHPRLNQSTFVEEARRQRENLATLASIPLEDIRGFRSPYLRFLGDFQIRMLQRIGYSYDSTLAYEWMGTPSGKPISPFTLDYGWPYYVRELGVTGNHRGFWEVPLNHMRHYSGNFSCPMTGCGGYPPDEETTFRYLWENFMKYYKGSKIPFGINTHYYFFDCQERLRGMDRFIQALLNMDDVYIVSIKKTLDWLKSPTPLEELKTFAPWSCGSHVPYSHGRRSNSELPYSITFLSILLCILPLLCCVKMLRILVCLFRNLV